MQTHSYDEALKSDDWDEANGGSAERLEHAKSYYNDAKAHYENLLALRKDIVATREKQAHVQAVQDEQRMQAEAKLAHEEMEAKQQQQQQYQDTMQQMGDESASYDRDSTVNPTWHQLRGSLHVKDESS